MCGIRVIRDRTILANRPDTILRAKKEKTCLLIDIAITDDSNINRKDIEKTKQVQRPGNRGQQEEDTGKTVPVINCTLGTIKKGSDRNLQLVAGHHSTKELLNTTLMDTAHSICTALG